LVQPVDNNSEFIRSRDDKTDLSTIISSIRKFFRQLFCIHYWYADIANPYSLSLYSAECLKCGKVSLVCGVRIDEVRRITYY